MTSKSLFPLRLDATCPQSRHSGHMTRNCPDSPFFGHLPKRWIDLNSSMSDSPCWHHLTGEGSCVRFADSASSEVHVDLVPVGGWG
jgi:hypothetical protein